MTTRPSSRRARGAALVTALVLMGILALVVSALLIYVNRQRLRNVSTTQGMLRTSCAEGGLQYARAYFSRNQANWNTYLAKPSGYGASVAHPYNPVKTDWNPYPADPTSSALQGSSGHPELFTDLDGDGNVDVYIYIRDNDDEMTPADPDWGRDNDQNVVIGAVCISNTLVPRRDNGTVDTDRLMIEGLLSVNLPANGYRGQNNGGTSGTGNVNGS